MSVAITVRNASKRYRIGVAEERSETFAGQIMDMVKAPLRNLRHLRSLSRFNDEDESVFWALRNISFDVQEGEVLGIIGHNGAGKSTLLKILSRITEPTTGEIKIKGRVSSLLEVGTGFHPDLTGRENIYMNGTILGMRKKEIDRKLDEIIAFSGVSKYIDTPVKRYSSGMKVRLAFSVAAHLEPEVLIIDEVLAVGDAEFQAKCLGKMEDVAAQGRTVLFVSHQMGAVSKLTTRCVWLDKGQVRMIGDSTDLVERYLTHNTELHNTSGKSDYFDQISVSVLNNEFEVTTSVDSNSTFKVKFSGIAGEKLKDVGLFYRIENAQGEIVSTNNSLDDDQYFSLDAGENFSIVHNVGPNVFIPGRYYITFAVHTKNGQVMEALFQIGSFEVNSVGAPKRFFKQKSTQGYFFVRGNWKRL